ncbi:polyprenyl synthetase family protein [Candidatus Gottesmanbacteria bacterium]|nr:polyprenyl synthetase family protein [Candidatus Gottesmanbacteria bacterium]
MIPLLQPSIDGLRKFLLEKNCFVSWDDPLVEKKIRDYIISGKLIRGGFIVHLLDKNNLNDALILGSALELAQSAFLIQDDIMDHDELRRGKPSLHVQLSGSSGKGDSGVNLALCISDYLFFQSQEFLASISDNTLTAKLYFYWSKQLKQVCVGQYADNYYASIPIIPSSKSLQTLYKNKTSSYTFCIPIVTSAMFLHLSDPTIAMLEKIADDLGVLFQLSDDMLNVYGKSELSGKPTESDIREKKKTLLLSHIYEASDVDTQKKLEQYYVRDESNNISDTLLCIHSPKAKQLIQHEVDSMHTSVKNLLKDVSIPNTFNTIIESLLDFIATRNV